jgi:hypothetical protein
LLYARKHPRETMRQFKRPEKKAFKKVVGAACTDAQRVVHPATRERDSLNLDKVQRERALKPPPLRIPLRHGSR